MPSLCDVPICYFILALVIASYQGYMGFIFQWILAREVESSESLENSPQEVNTNYPEWTRLQKIFLLCFANTLLYSISTLFGFLALFISYYVLKNVPSLTSISAGLSALIIFLVVFGVLGVWSAYTSHATGQGSMETMKIGQHNRAELSLPTADLFGYELIHASKQIRLAPHWTS